MKATKKKTPTDLTLRNLRAMKKRLGRLEAELSISDQLIADLYERVMRLEKGRKC